MPHDPDRHEMLVVSYQRATLRAARLEILLVLALASACILGSLQLIELVQHALTGG